MSIPNPSFAHDICLSFAGEDREYVNTVADLLRSRGVRVFYDGYEQAELWGKNLYTHLDEVYRKSARYCVMFISKHYKEKLWTNHERESAQARAFLENREYILPARFDDTEVPGMLPTIGYIDLRKTSPADLASLILVKLGGEFGKIKSTIRDLRSDAAIPLLLQYTSSQNVADRCEAVEELGNRGDRAKRAVPELVNLLGDAAGEVRVQAARALDLIDPSGEFRLPFLVTALEHSNEILRESVTSELAQIGYPAVVAVLDGLANGSEEFARNAEIALRHMGASAIRPLISALGDRNPNVRRAAAITLAEVEQDGRKTFEEIEKAVSRAYGSGLEPPPTTEYVMYFGEDNVKGVLGPDLDAISQLGEAAVPWAVELAILMQACGFDVHTHTFRSYASGLLKTMGRPARALLEIASRHGDEQTRAAVSEAQINLSRQSV